MHDIPRYLARPPPALPRPTSSRATPPARSPCSLPRCHFLLQNLRFETEIGISTAHRYGQAGCAGTGTRYGAGAWEHACVPACVPACVSALPPRGSSLRCHFLLQNLRFETEIGISTAYGCGRGWCVCGRAGAGRRGGGGAGARGWRARGVGVGGRAGSAVRAAAGSVQGDGMVYPRPHHHRRIRRRCRSTRSTAQHPLGPTEKVPGQSGPRSRQAVSTHPFTALSGAQLLIERMRQHLVEARDFYSNGL